MPEGHKLITWLTRGAAAALFIAFLATSFRTGWTQSATDFPNYYTAAVSVREGRPLRNYYDWDWFNQQIKHVGIENQLGGYAPQTPLTMLPMIPLAGLSPMNAKRVWLAINLLLLAATVIMLAQDSGKPVEQIALLALLGHSSLASNFIYGQYYVFLLFLIALIHRTSSGFLAGVTFALKLYTGPLLLYYIVKRNWRNVAEMLAAMACAGALAIAIFGWSDIAYYLTQVLPRSLDRPSTDPYNPGVPTISNLLRHVFVSDPVLNPAPLFEAPSLFYFLRTVAQAGLITFAALGVAFSKSSEQADFGWFIILCLPCFRPVLPRTHSCCCWPRRPGLLRDASPWKGAYLVASYILLNSNLQPIWLFPKVWLLLSLFVVLGWERFRAIPNRAAIGGAIAVLALAVIDARLH